MHLVSLEEDELDGLLDRQRRFDRSPDLVPVPELFREILRIADRFVPSEAGSVLIDDPALKAKNLWTPEANELVFVACYGEKADHFPGRRISAVTGVVGKTYLSGVPMIATEAKNDKHFYPDFDKLTDYETRSIICVPIHIGRSACGVLELINRRDRSSYQDSELELLKIFAAYISTTLQNVMDANRYRELAKRDDLTGLYNDRYFNQRLNEEIERADAENSDLSLIFIDLDHFKSINDQHGHLVGSQTLREVGLILARAVDCEEATICRYGGDEFVIIVPGLGIDKAAAVAERIRGRIEKAVFQIDPGIEGSGILIVAGVITASIGVSSYRHFTFDERLKLRARKNELIRSADQSMYEAKAGGKNRVCHGIYRPEERLRGLIETSQEPRPQ